MSVDTALTIVRKLAAGPAGQILIYRAVSLRELAMGGDDCQRLCEIGSRSAEAAVFFAWFDGNAFQAGQFLYGDKTKALGF